MRGKLDQLSCKLKRCRYAMKMREIEVSKRELGRYVPKMTKTGISPANAGDVAALRELGTTMVYCTKNIMIKLLYIVHISWLC